MIALTVFQKIISSPIVNCIFMGWFVAQFLKFIGNWIFRKDFNILYFFTSGGMPSSHSSLVTSLAVILLKIYGYQSAEFGISLALAVIIMYDASGVRRQAGKHAQVLNQIVEILREEDVNIIGEKLKELLGHSPFEVFMGALLGIAVGLIMPV